MTWAAVASAAATVISGAMSNNANKKAAGQQAAGLQKGMDTINGFYDDAKGYMQPYMNSGLAGNSALMGLLSDPNSIADSAAYKFRFGQGMAALDNSAAARGGLFGGGHQKELVDFGQGLASQEYGNQWNRLMGLTQLGQNSAMGLGQLGMGAGNSIANIYAGMGNAKAGATQANGMNGANMIGSIGSLAGSLFGGK